MHGTCGILIRVSLFQEPSAMVDQRETPADNTEQDQNIKLVPRNFQSLPEPHRASQSLTEPLKQK